MDDAVRGTLTRAVLPVSSGRSPVEDEPVGWVLLQDPSSYGGADGADAPTQRIAGGWPVHADGEVGAFHVNELHRGADEDGWDSPGDPDPIGTALELVVLGRADFALVQLLLADCAVHLAVNADGWPLVVRSADDRLCILVATCAERRAESAAPEWTQAGLAELVDLLPIGTDVLFNESGPVPVRVDEDLIRDAPLLSPDAASLALQGLLAERAGGLLDTAMVTR